MTPAPAAAILRRVSAPRGRIAGWGLGVLAAANAGVVVWLWLRSGGIADVEDGATLLSAAGRITGLLGAYLALLELLLLARLPALERLLGFDRLTTWHRWCGTGGSSGVGYLRSTLDKRCFPELWGLRSRL